MQSTLPRHAASFTELQLEEVVRLYKDGMRARPTDALLYLRDLPLAPGELQQLRMIAEERHWQETRHGARLDELVQKSGVCTDTMTRRSMDKFTENLITLIAWGDEKLLQLYKQFERRRYEHTEGAPDDEVIWLPHPMTDDPWRKLKHVFAFPFVDTLAQHLGWWSTQSVERARYIMLKKMLQLLQQDTSMSKGQLHYACCGRPTSATPGSSSIDVMRPDIFQEAYNDLVESGDIRVLSDESITSEQLYHAEQHIALTFTNTVEACERVRASDGAAIATAIEQLGVAPSEEQVAAIRAAFEQKVSIIQGMGGSGKTSTCVSAIVHAGVLMHHMVCCLTPTHQARRTLNSTLSSALGGVLGELLFSKTSGRVCTRTVQSFVMTRKKPGPGAFLFVVDEASMIASRDLSNLLYICLENSKNRIVLCGDHGQCLPIAAGCPFMDLLLSEQVHHVTRLTHVYRTRNAQINTLSRQFHIDRTTESRPTVMEVDDFTCDIAQYHRIQNNTIDLGCECVEKLRAALSTFVALGYLQEDVLVVTHTKMDSRLYHCIVREFFGGHAVREDWKYRPYAAGDRVVFTRNTVLYKNGDSAELMRVHYNNPSAQKLPPSHQRQQVDGIAGTATVAFVADAKWTGTKDDLTADVGVVSVSVSSDGHWLVTANVPLSDICPGYAVTTHKAQSIQAKAVVAIYTYKGRYTASADVVYTGVSRAQEVIHLLSNRDVMYHARPKYPVRHTMLPQMLRGEKIDMTHLRDIKDGKAARECIPDQVRWAAWRVSDECCAICLEPLRTSSFYGVHIVSPKNCGTHTLDNVRPCCTSCHHRSGSGDLSSMKRHYASIFDVFEEADYLAAQFE